MNKQRKIRRKAAVLLDLMAALTILLTFMVPAVRIAGSAERLLSKAEDVHRLSRLMQRTVREVLSEEELRERDEEYLAEGRRIRIRVEHRESFYEQIILARIFLEDEEGERCETEVCLRRPED